MNWPDTDSHKGTHMLWQDIAFEVCYHGQSVPLLVNSRLDDATVKDALKAVCGT